MKKIIAAVALAAAGCASAAKQPVACYNEPQWFASGSDGKPAYGIHVCFGEDHRLLWDARPLPPQPAAAPAPQPAAAPAAPPPPAPARRRRTARRRAQS